MSTTYQSLLELDAQLKSAGFYPLTAWWREQLERWYAHPTATRFVGQVGRGGVKSHTAVKVALNEALLGDWSVPMGEVHFFALVSQNKAEAGQRLRQLSAMLRALGIEFEQRDDEIVLPELARGFRVFAATIGAVSGFRCFGFVGDELAKWSNADKSANPAPEVIASLRAMCVTHRRAREFLISSPLAKDGLHYRHVLEGDTSQQLVASAPSWVANPDGITQADTVAREPDERVWLREYCAIPQDAKLAAFPRDAVLRAFIPYEARA